MARMLPGEAEMVSEWTGLSGKAKSVKRFERSNGLDTALYKTYHLPFFLHVKTGEDKRMTAAADKQACRKKGSNYIRPRPHIDVMSATKTAIPTLVSSATTQQEINLKKYKQ